MRMKYCLGILIILLGACKSTSGYIVSTNAQNQRVALESPDGDQAIKSLIAPYKMGLDSIMNEELGLLDVLLIKERPECTLGNWMADMFFEEAQLLNDGVLDFAIQNQGGIRVTSIGKGPITRGEIFELMPFDNVVSIISAKGHVVRQLLDHIAEGKGWPVSSQLTFKIKNKKATDILIDGESLDEQRTYHFALPDYIAGGGSGTTMLKNVQRKDINVLIREVFIEHIIKDTKRGIVQTAKKEGRIINLDHE